MRRKVVSMKKKMQEGCASLKQYVDSLYEPQKETRAFAIIMLTSMLLRLFYICYISVYDMQHDVGSPTEPYGHLGYIAYLMQAGHLPDFDVREAFQFWHPPVHHGICALFLGMVWKIVPSLQGNYEPLQILPFLYVTISLWLVWKILKLWGYCGGEALFPFLIIAFNPTFVILSGSVNNDPLCVMFMILAVYFAVMWYRTPKYSLITGCALAIGLGMSTKGTAALVAAPVAFIFLIKLWKERMKIFGQLVTFAVMVFPLGLWWYIRNYVAFGVPVNYIYYTDTDAIGYLGYMPAWKRMLDFDIHYFSFENLYLQFEGKYTDKNPIIGLLKTVVFGQWRYNYNPYIKILAYALLVAWIVLVIVALSAIVSFVKRRKTYCIESAGIVIFFLMQLISYYYFCITYPFVWTMDIRYAVPILLCISLFLAEFMDKKKRYRYLTVLVCSVFTIISSMCFVLLAFTDFAT